MALTKHSDPNASPEYLLVAAYERPDEVMANAAMPLIQLEDAIMYKRIVCVARLMKMRQVTNCWISQHVGACYMCLGVCFAHGWRNSTAEFLAKSLDQGRPPHLVMYDLIEKMSDVSMADGEEMCALEMEIEGISHVIRFAPEVQAPKADWDW